MKFRALQLTWLPALATLAAGLGPADAGNLPVPCLAGSCGANAPTSWVSGGAATATQTANTLTVNQTSANAILNWSSFNIGAGSTVNFVQPSATALAINNIFQGSPSQIFGSLNANGRVYLINQNGIMFGGGAQVNTGGLVASSLNMAQSALTQGIASTAVGDPTAPSFIQFVDASGNPLPSGAVSVAPGATLNATGGQIFLFAPKVTNQGTITTPDGQTILAAGNAVYLATSPDPDVRGLLVAVDAGGTVTNGSAANATVTDPSKLQGQIVAQRGNITLMGLAVNQLGLLSADTAVRANGSILLVASDRATAGTLTLGANSVTEAPLDAADTSVAVDATVQQKSTVSLQGDQVDLAGGASVIATSGTVNITASSTAVQGSTDVPPAPTSSTSDGSRIYIANGASIDVSGATATLAMSSTNLTVQLRGSELSDDPTQRNGALRGQTVTVDTRQYGTLNGAAWVGTPLADLAADVATIQRGVLQRNETGGTVTLQSAGDVIVAGKATINTSGGASDYQSGFLQTSSLIGANGQIYAIGAASPDTVYIGVANTNALTVTDPRWGVTTVYNGTQGGAGQYEAGYIQGADAGTLAINAPHVVFDGALLANVQVGPYQRRPPTMLTTGAERPFDQLPLPGALDLGPDTTVASPFVAPDLILSSIGFSTAPVLPTLKNPDGGTFDPLTDPWPVTQTEILLNPALIGPNAAGRVSVASNGTISIPVDVDLQLASGGSFSGLGYAIDMAGRITGPGDSISLQTVPTAVGTGLSGITLERTAVLNVAGAWVNDDPAVTPPPATAPLAINGGSVSLQARDGNLALNAGALIDVSGGAQLTSTQSFIAGTPGAITIGSAAPEFAVPTQLTLGATLRGYAFQGGGSLSLSAASFCLTAGNACIGSADGTVTLAPEFFNSGGFGNYSLTANNGGLELTGGTLLNPVEQNFLVNSALSKDVSASGVGSLVSIGILPSVQRLPVSLTLSAQYQPPFETDVTPDTFAQASSLSIDQGAVIALDPLASLSLISNTRILDNGVISAPGGSVSMNVTATLAEPSFIAGHQIWLGPNSSVDVGGAAQTIMDDLGNTVGSVLQGGTVNLIAVRGAVETMPGSFINVSGTSATLDLTDVAGSGKTTFVPTVVASAGGSLTIEAAEAAVLDGTMLAKSGDPARVAAGSFSLLLNANLRYGPDVFADLAPPYPYAARIIDVASSQAPIVVAAGTDLPTSLEGRAMISAASLASAGFDAVSLQAASLDGSVVGSPQVPGVIRFDGNVAFNFARSLTLDAGSFLSDGGAATIGAPYLSLGQAAVNAQSIVGAPMGGTGTLQVNAAFIDLTGHTTFGNFATVTLNSSGDIRGNGVAVDTGPGAALDPQLPGALTVSGALDLIAQQIYPSTLTAFSFIAGTGSNGTGNIDILPASGAASGPVLSAGGAIAFSAPQITQGGTVRAPLGSIAFNATTVTLAAGSTTSTSADGAVIPFGETQGGFDWVYPLGGNQGLVYGTDGIALPAQSIALNAASVNIAKGATLNVKGGGDLLATEFVPGPTGTVDVLGQTGAFAILPLSNLQFAPYDPFYSTGSGVLPGQSVYLAGGGGVAAGTYAILPARYALLPGAYYVKPVEGYQDLSLGQQIAQPDGSVIVAGYDVFAGTNLGSSRTSGFDIQSGTGVLNLALYTSTGANQFFTAQANTAGVDVQRLPEDAGYIALSATTQLALNGTLQATPGAGGRGAEVDISSAAIRIVNGATAPPAEAGVLDLDANSLTALGAESILIGGTRAQTALGVAITTLADNVEVAGGATLKAPELLLAATNTVTVDSGATVGASGSAPASEAAFLLSQDGALLRVAAAGNPTIIRSGSDGQQGSVAILPGAIIDAPSGALSVDATASATFGGQLNLSGGSLAISGNQISLGNAPVGTGGIVLPTSVFAGLSLANLTLASRGSIDFYDGSSVNGTDITLNAGALRGFSSNDVSVSASNALQLSGTSSAASVSPGTGTGALNLSGGSVLVGAGLLDVSGFAQTNLASQGVLTLSGSGALSVAGNVGITAGLLTADSGTQQSITAGGTFSYAAAPNSTKITLPTELPLGASVSISAQSIAFDGSAQLHAGALSLAATAVGGDVALGSGASIDLSGVNTIFDSVLVASRAGTLNLQSQFGSVIAAAGSSINVAALDDSAPNAGALTVQAANGAINLSGALVGRGANVSLDGQSLGNATALETALMGGGFSGDWSLRLRGPGDMDVGAATTISGRSVTLTADLGSIDIEGTINSSAAGGGAISLSALNDVIVNGTLDARPTQSGDMNGQLYLSTRQGRVLVGAGATLAAYDPQVAIQSAADGGLWIRAPQSGLENVLTDPAHPGLVLAGNMQGVRSLTIEGYKSYANTTGILDANTVAADMSNPLYADAQNFMNTAPALVAALGPVRGPVAQIVPGIEIDSTQSLTLTTDWALDAWRFNGAPGVLTLRAAGDLNMDASLSDGFTGTTGASAFVLTSTGASWSYRLVAGADLGSSNSLAVEPLYTITGANGSGTLTLAAGSNGGLNPSMTMIRTGTGSIDIAAAGDVVLTNQDSVIYTAGIADDGITYSRRGQLAGLLYPTEGGNISINAGRDVTGAASSDLVTNWLWRVGSPDSKPQPTPAAWTVNFADFEQGVAALGGGNVSVQAGRDVNDLSVSVPTIGRQIGSATSAGSDLQILNQGDISIVAGNNVAGGTLYAGSGTAFVSAGNAITQSPTVSGLYPMILLGDASVTLSARSDATIAGVANPTLLPQGSAQNASRGGNVSFFSTYGPDSAVALRTVAGTAELLNDTSLNSSAVIQTYQTLSYDTTVTNPFDGNGVSSLRIYPGTVSVDSLRGDLLVDNTFTMFPQASGSLNLLAHGNVQLGSLATNASTFEIIESNADPALLPSPANPQGGYQYLSDQLNSVINLDSQNSALPPNAAIPVHLSGSSPDSTVSRIVASTGDIAIGNTSNSQIYFAAPARVVAGQDIQNLVVDFTNLSGTDVSAVIAGRDLSYTFTRDSQGSIDLVPTYIDIDGPGTLELVAGRNFNLGTSNGVTSRGNLQNTGLPSGGADVSVEAGIGDPSAVNYSTFIGDYLTPTGSYAPALEAYMQPILGTAPSAAQALAAFELLPTVEQAPFIQAVFFDELLASGTSAAAAGATHGNFTRGFNAIEALFPGGVPDAAKNQTNPYAGDISLYFSRIYTIDGGSIDLLAPGGLVNVGLAAPPTSFGITKQPSDLGLVAQTTGDINAYAYGDFEVNESRVFAANGGNILIWSTQGNIDAGRGSKTAISAPAPTITYVNGVPTVTFPAALAGSGIQTLATTEGVSPGNVGLFAPNGVVNANDAGIVAGNLTIAATAVLGASNIKVSGVSVGVPVEAGGLGASLAAVSAVGSSATQAATDSAQQNAGRQAPATIAEAALSWLDVFVEGFGADVCKPQDVECLKRQSLH